MSLNTSSYSTSLDNNNPNQFNDNDEPVIDLQNVSLLSGNTINASNRLLLRRSSLDERIRRRSQDYEVASVEVTKEAILSKSAPPKSCNNEVRGVKFNSQNRGVKFNSQVSSTSLLTVLPSYKIGNSRIGSSIDVIDETLPLDDVEACCKPVPPRQEDCRKDGFVNKLRDDVVCLLDQPWVDPAISFLLILYGLLVFIQVVMPDTPCDSGYADTQSLVHALQYVDFIMLCILLVELVLKTFAYQILIDGGWTIYDFSVIIVSLIIIFVNRMIVNDDNTEYYEGTTHVREALRVLRLIIIFRRLTEVYERYRSASFDILKPRNEYNSSFNIIIRTPLERTVSTLRDLIHRNTLPISLREDVKFILTIIGSGKLYDASPILPSNSNLRDRSSSSSSAANPRITNEAHAWVHHGSIMDHGRHINPTTALNGRRSTANSELQQARRHSRYSKAGTPCINEGALHNLFDNSPIVTSILLPYYIRNNPMLDNHLFDWTKFNAFCLNDSTNRNPLLAIALHTCHRFNLFEEFAIDAPMFHRYTECIQESYRKMNPYHNAIHACDVIQAMCWFLVGPPALLTQIDVHSDLSPSLVLLSSIITAMIHDVEHPGTNNAFHVKTCSPFAVRYNDKAVLENHHVAAAFSLLCRPDCRVFRLTNDDVFASMRELIIEMVLATDMGRHFQDLGKMKSRHTGDPSHCPRRFVEASASGSCLSPQMQHIMRAAKCPPGRFAVSNNHLEACCCPITGDDDARLVLSITHHAADISNPSRPLEYCLLWTERVMSEFFSQGDQERAMGMPISALMDRDVTNISKAQVGFIDVIVKPVFQELQHVMPRVFEDCVMNLDANRAYWEQATAQMEIEMQRGSQEIPFPKGSNNEFYRLKNKSNNILIEEDLAARKEKQQPLSLTNDMYILRIVGGDSPKIQKPSYNRQASS